MKQTLHLKSSQHLALTPQLKQSLRLLQLSSVDLQQEVQQVLDNNPLLEQVNNDNLALPDFEESVNQQGWQETIESKRLTHQQTGNRDQHDNEFTQFIYKEETLLEHLAWQIQMTTLSEKDKTIADTLLHCLDDEGYLTLNCREILPLIDSQLKADINEVHAVLSLIKTLDPVGIGAKDLTERLTILLNQLPQSSELDRAQQIVRQHLGLLGQHNMTELKHQLNATNAEVKASLALITQLTPHVTSAFKSNHHGYIVADIIVQKIDGHWHVDLNPDNQHKLSINQTYINMLNSNIDKQHSDYIQNHLFTAKTFIKNLANRYDTLLLVAQAIVKQQHAFFENGEQQMQPMTLQDIAQQLDLHESTISRATSGKYLLCPRGVYELKYFFSSALSNINGNCASSTAIRSLVKKIIDYEPKNKPFSDNKIAQQLEQQGYLVARRTVTKYREGMKIPSSNQRKTLT